MKCYWIIAIITCFLLNSCSCKDPSEKNNNPYLERDYNYVVGILAPDSLRTYRSEIFVGRFLDIFVHADEVDTNFYGEDTILYNQNLINWHYYRGRIIGDTEAKVYVTGPDGKKIEFKTIGHGYYRDINNQIAIQAYGKYDLEVQQKDNTYRASTIIPGNFEITNLDDGDLKEVFVTLNTSSPFYYGGFQINWTPSENAVIYRFERWNKFASYLGIKLFHDIGITSFDEIFAIDTTTGIPFASIDTATFKIIAIDSSWTQLYSPEKSFGAPPSFTEWWQQQTGKSITKRSNIQGPNVVGVFGSYNQTKRITFYMRGIR